jgi:hypothetical protein
MLGFEKQNLNWSFKEQIQNLPNLPNEELIWTEFFFLLACVREAATLWCQLTSKGNFLGSFGIISVKKILNSTMHVNKKSPV